MPVQVKKNAVKISGATATISSPALAKALVHNNTEAVAMLKQVHNIKVTDIGIDTKGRVTISNKQFANKLATRLGAAADNGVCGVKCGKQGMNLGMPVE